jgi:hypothetical protein
MKDPRDDEEIDIHEFDDETEDERMKRKFPDSTKESRNAGRFLGVDFPYVPGDPDF